MVDAQGHILDCNEAACAMLGFSREEMLALSIHDIDQYEDEAKAAQHIGLVISQGHHRFETRQRCKDGRILEVEVSARHVPVADGGLLFAFLRDVTQQKQAKEHLRESQEKLRLLIEYAPAALAMFDMDMCYVAVSRRWMEDYNLGDRDIIGHSHYEIFPEIGDEWRAVHRRALAGEIISKNAERFVRADGGFQWLNWEVRPWRHGNGTIGGIVIFSEDVTKEKEAETQLRVTARVFDQAGEAILVAGPDSIIQTVNAAFCRISGYSPSEAVGQRTSLLKSGRHSRDFYQDMWRRLSADAFWQGEIWNRRKNREIYPEWLTITRVDDERGQVAHYVAVFSDITQIKDSQRRVEFLATHDTLTELPNRTLFHDRLDQAMAQMHRSGSRLALLFIDLDNFKTINDTLGHNVGDALLRQVTTRLREAVRDIDTLARLGGDEFTAIISNCTTESANEVASRILNSLVLPFSVEERSLFITASVGIAFFPDDGEDAAELIKSADAAMYRAKEQGRNRVEFYVPDLQVRLLKRTMLESALREALRLGRLRLVYQPKVAMAPGYPFVGAEALVRWHDPELGEISPAEFIPIAEASGQILEVGRAIQRMLVTQVAKWTNQGLLIPTIAFNVSPRSIHEVSFTEELLAVMAEHDLPNNRIQVEITEGALLENSEAVVANLHMLATAGIRVAVDDFGTGYSSLSYLKRLPLTELKIDKSFVDGLGRDEEDEAIAKAVLALAHALGLETVAEGVETEEQVAWLTQAGCQIAQGYYFYRPLDPETFAKLMSRNAGFETTR